MKARRHNLQKKRPRAVLAAIAFGLPLMAAGGALAQTALPDPTRPPAGFVDELPRAGAPGVTNEPAGAVQARGAAVDAAEASRGLQSVLIPRHGKPVAIIDGKYVPLGERHDGYELVAVGESEVVLARGKVRKVLKLTPRAEKKTARTTGQRKEMQGRRERPAKPRKESETGR